MPMRTGSIALIVGLLVMTAVQGGQEASSSPPLGKEQDLLHRFEGDWYARTAVPQPGRDTPREYFGSEKCFMTLGNHWLACDYFGMEEQPIESHACLGYDPQKRKFVGVWVNNATSTLLVVEGLPDDSGKTLILRMQGTDPRTEKKFDQRLVYDFESGDHRTLKVYRTDEGGRETLLRETYFTRKATILGPSGGNAPFRPHVDWDR